MKGDERVGESGCYGELNGSYGRYSTVLDVSEIDGMIPMAMLPCYLYSHTPDSRAPIANVCSALCSMIFVR